MWPCTHFYTTKGLLLSDNWARRFRPATARYPAHFSQKKNNNGHRSFGKKESSHCAQIASKYWIENTEATNLKPTRGTAAELDFFGEVANPRKFLLPGAPNQKKPKGVKLGIILVLWYDEFKFRFMLCKNWRWPVFTLTAARLLYFVFTLYLNLCSSCIWARIWAWADSPLLWSVRHFSFAEGLSWCQVRW